MQQEWIVAQSEPVPLPESPPPYTDPLFLTSSGIAVASTLGLAGLSAQLHRARALGVIATGSVSKIRKIRALLEGDKEMQLQQDWESRGLLNDKGKELTDLYERARVAVAKDRVPRPAPAELTVPGGWPRPVLLDNEGREWREATALGSVPVDPPLPKYEISTDSVLEPTPIALPLTEQEELAAIKSIRDKMLGEEQEIDEPGPEPEIDWQKPEDGLNVLIRATKPTLLKHQFKASVDMTPEELTQCPQIPKGTELPVWRYYQQGSHYRIDTGLACWWVYPEHFEVVGKEKPEPEGEAPLVLQVPYFSQLDNATDLFGPGWRQCCTSSNAMLADYLLQGKLTRLAKEQGAKDAEDVYDNYVAKYGDTTSHDAQTKALRDLGIESYWKTDMRLGFFQKSLRADVPVVIGKFYKNSGHISIVVGYDPERTGYRVHDPYGSRRGASNVYDVGIGGKYDLFTVALLNKIWCPQGYGWGRVVTAVNGKPTGLKLTDG